MSSGFTTYLNDQQRNGKKLLAVLIDPDKASDDHLEALLSKSNCAYIDVIFVGGSVLTDGEIHSTISSIKKLTTLPCIIFPGSADQICNEADGILLLSLISGRNPDLLIGKHVESALQLQRAQIEIIPTAYILVDGGTETTVSYISGTRPLPADKPGLVAVTALAGEQLGKALIYMDAGSGAKNPISTEVIEKVRSFVTRPIVIGGGIKTADGVQKAWDAGADVVVVGNVLETDPAFLATLRS
jgi:phosphoglycerol geranylgeranyltransferase